MSKIYFPTNEVKEKKVTIEMRPDDCEVFVDGKPFNAFDELPKEDDYIFVTSFVVSLLQAFGATVELKHVNVVEFDEEAPEWDALKEDRSFEPIGVRGAEVRLVWWRTVSNEIVKRFEDLLTKAGAARIEGERN